MRPFIICSLLALATPAVAQAPTPPANTTAPQKPADTSGPPAALLDTLVKTQEIVGLTKTDGSRYLAHIISGDHGLYIAQTFQFAGPPRTTTQTVGSGRKRRTTQVKTPTTIPDDTAVRLLLQGVAGSNTRPGEVYGPRDMFSAKDVKFLQTLSPPQASKPAPVPPGAPVPPPASKSAWTMTTLWPLTNSQTPPLKNPGRGRRK